jgi:hypothetical protein
MILETSAGSQAMVSSALVAPPELSPLADVATAQALNSNCFCTGLDEAALRAALELEVGLGQPGLFELVQQRCPHIFSAQPVFVARRHLQRMADLVRAVESAASLPAWRDTVLAKAPAIARHDPDGARSVLFGYDFHLSGDRLSLVEINTNAGGATNFRTPGGGFAPVYSASPVSSDASGTATSCPARRSFGRPAVADSGCVATL